jgi:hypothetical protein
MKRKTSLWLNSSTKIQSSSQTSQFNHTHHRLQSQIKISSTLSTKKTSDSNVARWITSFRFTNIYRELSFSILSRWTSRSIETILTKRFRRVVKESVSNEKDTITITTNAVNKRRFRLQITFTEIIHIHIILHHEIISCLFIVWYL